MRKNNRGFTLIEVVVAVSILAIGIVAISDIFSISLRSLKATRDHMDLSIIALSEMRTVLLNSDLEEGIQTRENDNYIVETMIEESAPEKTEGLPYKLLLINVSVKKGEKVSTLATLKLVETVFK
jgi:prepilin-type N-terminal cleavage/methylation domain-containing protein